MEQRPAARLLLLDETGRVLLFRFGFSEGALAGVNYWATPGGALEDGETFAEAARRELLEETGIAIESVEDSVADIEFVMSLADGRKVLAHEKYFVVRAPQQALSSERWTDEEKKVVKDHRWWSVKELQEAEAKVYPENLSELLMRHANL